MSDIHILKASSELSRSDQMGAIKVRLGVGRNHYTVNPGLYSLGAPDPFSPVLVTANYKLTFDTLRSCLKGLNLWIVVLDTKGINVWCAAGKGTFGTNELIHRIKATRLEEVVIHRNLILPQLGAPGVKGFQVTKETGFKVIYGPIRAEDIPAYLANNMTASDKMRRVTFTLKERLLVVPVEIKYAIKLIPALFILLILFNIIKPSYSGFENGLPWLLILKTSFFQLIPHIVAFLLGTVGIAALLPYIPGKSFALKGALMGVLWSLIVIRYASVFSYPDNLLAVLAHGIIAATITSFFALNFTGSTTFTSPSGVQKETVVAIPIMAITTLVALVMLVMVKIL